MPSRPPARARRCRPSSSANADRDVIQLSGDDLRPLHPDYTRLMRENPLLMVDATTQAINPWMQMARDHATANGYSLVMEGTFRNPDAVIADAEQFAQAGIPVEVVALAVREERSRLDALDRSLPTADAEMALYSRSCREVTSSSQ